MPVDDRPGDRAQARRRKRRYVAPKPSPDVQDRLEAGRSVVPPPVLSPGGRIAQRVVSPPAIQTPDTADRRRRSRIENLKRGASASGGPGTRAFKEAERLARRVKTGRATVNDVQYHLRKNGYNIEIDGEWGPQTNAAWERFVAGLGDIDRERGEQAQDVMVQGLANPDPEMERAALGGGAFGYSLERDKIRAEEMRQAEIRDSMKEWVRTYQPKSAYDRWGLIPNVQRAGEYLSRELAAPAIGSTKDFFEAIPAVVATGGDPRKLREEQLQAQHRRQMGTLDARVIGEYAEIADNFVQDLYQSTVGAPAGIAYFVAHPIEAAKLTWNDYKYRYGPLFDGDTQEFYKRQKEHPLFAVLDVASVLNVGLKAGQVGGVVAKGAKIRKLKVGEGYVQLYQPGSALGQYLAARMDAFSEKHPDLAFVGANQRGANAIRNASDRTLDEIRATTVRFQRAAKRLNPAERMAYDVMARYSPDMAPQFLELEINKRWAAANDKEVPRAVRFAQKAQHRALRQAAYEVINPSENLMRALTLGRELTEGPGLSTEQMKFSLKMLDPETAAGRKDLTAQIFGDMPDVGEVASRTALYQYYRELFPEHAATVFMHMADSAAKYWARETGGKPEDWYRQYVSEARAKIDPDLPEDLPEGNDLLAASWDETDTMASPIERRNVEERPVSPDADVQYRQRRLSANAGIDLDGLPGPVKVGGQDLHFRSYGPAQRLADEYMAAVGLPYERPATYAKANPELGRQVAKAYDEMKHAPNDPEVRASYDAFARETLLQYHAIRQRLGIDAEFYPEDGTDPYPLGPRQAALDVLENRHMYVYPTEAGFGTVNEIRDHPLLQRVPDVEWGGKPVTYNDLFRFVHDVFGHIKEGVGFRADGEFNAFRQHAAMYSPLARRAMMSETHGQNSWVNYGPHGDKNRTAKTEDTVFADQKAGLLPEELEEASLQQGPGRLAQDGEEPDWVIPEDVDAWVREGAQDPMDVEGLSDRPDIPFTPVEARLVDMRPAPPQMPTMRRLPDESDADFQKRTDAANADYAMRQAAYDATKPLPYNERVRAELPEEAVESINEIQEQFRPLIEEALDSGQADNAVFHRFRNLVRDWFERDGFFPGEEKKIADLVVGEITSNYAKAKRESQTEIPPDWLAQQAPSVDDYVLENASAGQVGVHYKGQSGDRRRGWVYFPDRERAERFVEDQVKRRKYLLENFPDFYYQRAAKFGVVVKPDAGTVRGVTDFRFGQQARIGLNPDAVNFSTPIHETAHVIRRFLPEPALRRLEEILDVEDGVWKRADEEKFAKMVESYFWRGQEPNWQLRSQFAIMREGMRSVYRQAPRPGGIGKWEGQRLYNLLDEIFDPTLGIKAGEHAFFLPDVASWRGRGATSGRRKSLRQQKVAKHKNRGVLMGQGRVQRGPKVTVMEFNRTARLYENRLSISELNEFASDIDLDAHPETGGVPPGYGLFNPQGVDVPRIFRETPTSDDFFGRFPHEMAREMQQERDTLLAYSFPNDLELVPDEYRNGVKVLPLQIIEAFTGDKVAIRMARSPRIDKLMATVDISNAIFKAALIYGKLSYIPLNFAGNMVFLTLAAGPFAGPALVRAARGIGGLDPEFLSQIDFHVGEGAAAALALEERNALVRGINHLAYAQSAVADRLPRRAAWIYYAGKAGFINEGSIRKLLEGGNEVWKDGVTYKQARFQISEAAERSMVQFRGMSPFQQEVISRAVFIYGWLRGATKYGLHSAIERPMRTNFVLQQGQHQWDELQERFGKLVSYLDGITPVGKMKDLLGVETVPVRSTQAINPVSTAGEALAAIYNTAKGDMKQAGPVISDYISPALKTPIEFATGYNIFFGEQYDNRWEAVYGQPLRWPAIKIGKQLISPDVTAPDIADRPVEQQPNFIVPSESAARKEALEEIFLGSARKRNLNPAAAEARGREQRGEKKGYADYREELIDRFEEAGMGRPPEVVLQELEQQVKLDADPRLDKGSSYKEKLAATAEVAGADFDVEGMTEAAAESYYLKLRKAMFSNLNKWENQADKIIDAQLEEE